jgi:hypothetical protein
LRFLLPTARLRLLEANMSLMAETFLQFERTEQMHLTRKDTIMKSLSLPKPIAA